MIVIKALICLGGASSLHKREDWREREMEVLNQIEKEKDF